MGCSTEKSINVDNNHYVQQKILKNHTNPVLYQSMKYILKQMETCICKIIYNNHFATGFFCVIPFPDMNNLLPVLITNNHVLNSQDIKPGKEIEFTINDDKFFYKILIDEKRKVYTNIKFDTTIIEIKKTDKNILLSSFLEIDEEIFNDNLCDIYEQKSVYLIHYPNGNKMEYSPGIIKNLTLDDYDIRHLCPSEKGSSGSPIINLLNYKVIGVHKGSKESISTNYNLGTLIKGPLEEFNKLYKNSNNQEIIKKSVKIFKVKKVPNTEGIDEITIKYRKNKIRYLTDSEIEEIKDYFGETISDNKLFGEKFVDMNKDICHIILNGEETELISHYEGFNNNEILEIKLKGLRNVDDLSNMIFGCSSLMSLSDISKINTKNVTSLKNMFFGCLSLLSLPDISNWDISNVEDLSGIFSLCKEISTLPDISKWNTENVNDFSLIFSKCLSLNFLPNISNWKTDKALTMFGIFQFCPSLKSLPDISKWNTNNVTNMNSIFNGCSSLISLPDISKWNTSDVITMNNIFHDCSSLQILPDISKWSTENIEDMSNLFSNCSSLISLPDISHWNTNKVNDISSMFENCKKLKNIPDISKWNTNKITNISYLFYQCLSLKSLPNISRWETKEIIEMDGLFGSCSSLKTIPDISKWNTKKSLV